MNHSDYSRFSPDHEVKIPEEQEENLLGDSISSNSNNKMYINRGLEDEMEICCYRRSKFRTFLTWLFFLLTCGILRLIYHWIPKYYLFSTSVKCKTEEAEKILIIDIFNDKHKTYFVKNVKILTPESIKKHINGETLSNDCDYDLQSLNSLSLHIGNGIFRKTDRLITFSVKKMIYILDEDKQEFVRLKALDKGVSCSVLHDNTGLTSEEQIQRRTIFGSNEIEVKESSILKLILLELLNPFYIFQIWSFILWFLDNYYYYAGCIISMTSISITMTALQTKRNQKNLKSTIHSSDVCTVIRKVKRSAANSEVSGNSVEYKSDIIDTSLLVPGDILEIPAHGCIMHCDAVLLTGSCILNESMLTGESVPVTKTALPNESSLIYDPKEHARHTLFCGTKVILTRYYEGEKVKAVVIRTGFTTAKGSLVRSILYPPPVDFKFEKDSYKFIGFLAGVAAIGFIYTIVMKVMRGADVSDIIIKACDLITIVVPPALPAAMTVGRYYAQKRLKAKQIFCISPRSINVSGSINCVCFDKTGTLTEDGLDLLCVVPIKNNIVQEQVKKIEDMPCDLFFRGLVCCHSLTIIEKEIVGDPLDLKMFESTKWAIDDENSTNKYDTFVTTVLKPPKQNGETNEDLSIGVIREFPFSSSSQRMGVIVRSLSAQNFEYYCKGSPERILKLIKKGTYPDNVNDILEKYTQDGYRVIALAYKELTMKYSKAVKVDREILEQDMTLLGLIVFENRLKPETEACIKALNDAETRVIMVTGDNIMTALSVARDCDIITEGQSVIVVHSDNSSPPNLRFTLADSKNKMPTETSMLSNSASIMSLDTVESQIQTNSIKEEIKQPTVYNNYRFALTGDTWSVVREHPDILLKVVTRGAVFARMAPEQKQELVQELQNLGYFVAMCGDGANDCGALKAAHIGISLSDAESSVASPFTSKNPNINCVLDVVKEGRAALVTSFGIFKYMAAYSLCQFVSVMILYSIESNLTDMEFLYIDLGIISVFAYFFGKTESYKGKLVKETPLTSLVSLSPLLSLTFQMILVISFQVAAFEHLKVQDWYIPFNFTEHSGHDDNMCVENYVLYSMSSFQYIALAIVFSKGKPYRQSIFSNYGLIIGALIMTAVSIYMAIYPAEALQTFFELELPSVMDFRYYVLLYALAYLVLSILIEHYVVEEWIFKVLRKKFHNVKKSKKKYLVIEHGLNKDLKWPPLSDYEPTISPSNVSPTYEAKFVEERSSFDRSHILNTLFTVTNENNIANSTQSTPRKPNFFPAVSNLLQNNETGYFSEDNLFSSIPSQNFSSRSETYQSLSNATNYDLANSQINIDDLPYDNENPSHKIVIENGDVNMSNFNSFNSSPQNKNLDSPKAMEMNNFDLAR